MSRATLLLGSNLGDRQAYLRAAREQIVLRVGPIGRSTAEIRTEPWGYRSDNYYINQIITVDNPFDDPLALLDVLQQIEFLLGRQRELQSARYADRTIDIDILYIDDLHFDHPRLTVPHPRIGEREFVQNLLALLSR